MQHHRTHPLLQSMTENEIKTIKSIEIIREYDQGELVIQTNQRNRDLICINQGKVSIQVEDTGGSIHEIAQIEAGNMIGDMNFVIPTRRTADVVALTRVEASIFPYQALTELLLQNPTLAAKVFSAMNVQLARKYMAMLE